MISQMPELASLEKGVLDEKYRLVMAIYKEDLKTKRFVEMRKKIETLRDQQKAGNEVTNRQKFKWSSGILTSKFFIENQR